MPRTVSLNIFVGDFPGGAVLKNLPARTSLVAQCLKIRLPMQGTRVWSLVREDPTCRGATKPAHHNYWACALQLLKPAHSRARVPQLLKPMRLEPMLHKKRSHSTTTRSSPHSPQLEKALAQQRRPNAAKKKKKLKKNTGWFEYSTTIKAEDVLLSFNSWKPV